MNRAVKARPPWCACDVLAIEVGQSRYSYTLVRGTLVLSRTEYKGEVMPWFAPISVDPTAPSGG